MIHSAAVKLTLAYLTIIMALSVGFSVILYRLSSSEISRGLRRPQVVFQIPDPRFDYEQFRRSQLAESSSHLLSNLVVFNIFTLVAGGVISYFLALWTLKPIEESMEAQSRFTADASHELRTPLTVMQTEVEVALRNSALTLTEAKGLLHSNLEEVNKLKTLSESLLQLARQNNEPLDFQIVQLKDIISGVVKRVKPISKAKDMKMKINISALEFEANQNALEESLVILLDNAIKYSEPNKSITIVSKLVGHNLKLEVIDQGFGIKSEDQTHVFERFYRVDNSRSKNNNEGYGLGLAIADQIIKLHHGSITLTSLPGKGSTFSIILPLKQH